MGLFNKHKTEKKEETSSIAPPVAAPPVATAPSLPNQNGSELSPPSDSVENIGSLSSPPVPGGNLEDIKEQVTAPITPAKSEDKTEISASNSEMSNLSGDDDSLFDFSSLDIPTPNEDMENSISSTEVETHENLDTTSSTVLEDKNSTLDLDSEIKPNSDSSLQSDFISNRSLNSQTNLNSDNFFVTTSQFKSFLEIIESVKERVKSSSETHLRLLDIKSEEDIEFENLRKDFQFIEDKLYEVDNLIFNK